MRPHTALLDADFLDGCRIVDRLWHWLGGVFWIAWHVSGLETKVEMGFKNNDEQHAEIKDTCLKGKETSTRKITKAGG